MQKANEPKNGEILEANEDDLHCRYVKLQECVFETIKEVVPEKKWIKKNGRVVSKETKALFEKRAREFQKQKPTADRRKRWNKKIRIACRNDYRKWVPIWVQKIERADNQGDTKAIFRGVKALSGSGQGGSDTQLVEAIDEETQEKKLIASKRIEGPEELAEVWQEFLGKKFSKTVIHLMKLAVGDRADSWEYA